MRSTRRLIVADGRRRCDASSTTRCCMSRCAIDASAYGALFKQQKLRPQPRSPKMPPRRRAGSPIESPALPKAPRLRTCQSTVRDAGGKAARGGQTYGIPTYDALFKHILNDSFNRDSFLQAFLSKAGITHSYRLDENMNPLQELQSLREFVHRKGTAKTVASISSDFIVSCPSRHKSHGSKQAKATDFLNEMVRLFEDIKKAFPKAKYNEQWTLCASSTMENFL